jgi:murein DD-endopeptidase MepM/ murein hydrolase activator NlpD
MSIDSVVARIGEIQAEIQQLVQGPSPTQTPSTSFASELASAQAPGAAPATAAGPSQPGSLVPAGAKLSWQRIDQGQDLQTDPGGPLLALGDGYVKQIASDPGGFGPDYPVLHFTSGPLAGRDVYYGHTHSALAAGQHFTAGQVVSHTGTSGVGNATVGGWAEVGFWPPGSMDAGAQIAPLLHN